MKEYFIKGTISFEVKLNGDSKIKSKIKIVPKEGFLSPEENQKAIAFPVLEDTKALLKELKNKSIELNIKDKDSFAHLLALSAVQQKLVEIRLDENWEILGFIFPAL